MMLVAVAAALLGAGLLGVAVEEAEAAPVQDPYACDTAIVQDLLFGRYCYTADGMQKLFSHLDGSFLGLTHGGDPEYLLGDPFGADEEPTPYTPGAPPTLTGGRYTAGAKEPHCVTPDSPDPAYYAHVIYARYKDETPNTYAEKKPLIQQLIREINGFLWDSTAEMGQAKQYKVHCTDGDITVSEAVINANCGAADCFSDMTAKLKSMGYDDPKVKYWIWTEDTRCGCGGKGTMFPDTTAGITNNNNGNMGNPMYAVTFKGDTGIRVMMHENGHNMGAVQDQPNPKKDAGANNVGHCWDGVDIMCYGEPNEAEPYTTTACAKEQWDCNADTYCNPKASAGSYLDKNWNLCKPYNRYLVAGNARPDLLDDTAEVLEDGGTILIDILANDSDTDENDTLYVHDVATPPSGGTAVWNETRQLLEYAPGKDFAGNDVFNYRVRDRANASAETVMIGTAKVNVTVFPVNDAPKAFSKAYILEEDTSLALTLKGLDVEGSPISFEVLKQPKHGELTGTAPQLTYTPDPEFYDRDTLTYRVSDGELESDIATITLHVTPVNDPPTARDDAFIAFMTVPGQLLRPLDNDDVSPDDRLSGSSDDESFHFDLAGFTQTDPPNDPPVYVSDRGGTFTVHPGQPGDTTDDFLEYTPPADFESIVDGLDTIGYRICDTDGSASGLQQDPVPLCSEATIEIEVLDSAVVAFADRFSTLEDTKLTTVALDSVLASGEPLADDWPSKSDAGFRDVVVEVVDEPLGELEVDSEGALVYTPPQDFYGEDIFTYRFHYDGPDEDGQPLEKTSNTVPVYIEVTSVNDVPQAHDDAITMVEDQDISILLAGTDVEDDAGGLPLSFEITKEPAHGTLRLVGAVASYRPSAEFSGDDHFLFRVTDADGATHEGRIDLSVLAVNDAPVAVPDHQVIRPDRLNRITPDRSILVNDIDYDGDALKADLVRGPDHGELELYRDGSFEYTPAPGFRGLDTFTYQAVDIHNVSSRIVPVGLHVQANSAPVAEMEITTLEGDRDVRDMQAGRPIRLTSLSYDVDGPIVRWQWDADGEYLSDDEQFTHTFNEADRHRITLTVWDHDGAAATASRALHIVDGYHVSEGGSYTGGAPAVTLHYDPAPVREGSYVEVRASADRPVTSWTWEQMAGPEAKVVGTDTDTIGIFTPGLGPEGLAVSLAFQVTAFDGTRASVPVSALVPVTPDSFSGALTVDVPWQTIVYGGDEVRIVPTASDPSATFDWYQSSGAKVDLRSDDGALRFTAPYMTKTQNFVFQVTASTDEMTSEPTRLVVKVMAGVAPDGIAVEPKDGYVDLSPRIAAALPASMSVGWDFGDGTTAEGAAISHKYAPGTYNVTMFITDTVGYERIHTTQIVVPEQAEEPETQDVPPAVTRSDGAFPVGIVVLIVGIAAMLGAAGYGLATFLRRR